MKTKPERQSKAKQYENRFYLCVSLWPAPKEIWGFFIVRIEYEGRKGFKCVNLGSEGFRCSERVYGVFLEMLKTIWKCEKQTVDLYKLHLFI